MSPLHLDWPRLAAPALLAGMSLTGIAFAQLTSDQVPRGRTVPAREEVRRDVERSRFRLGPIRVTPVLEVTDAGYDDNVFGAAEGEPKVADWSATVRGGARFILPMASKLYLKGEALPGYVWNRELTERNTVIGTYEGSFLALFNRMSLELRGTTSESFAYFSSETDSRVVQKAEAGHASLEVDVTSVVSLYAGAVAQRQRFQLAGAEPEDFPDLGRFDRDEAAARGGLRLRLSPSFDVSAGVEGTRTEFAQTPEEQDNESVAYLAGIHFDRPRFFVNVAGGYRRGFAYHGSLFPEYKTSTGSYFASYFLTPKVELRVYGRRRVVYGRFLSNSYFFETRNGGGVNFEVLPRLLIRGYAEFGPNEYPQTVSVGDGPSDREDDVTTYGGGLSLRLFRNAVISATAYQSDYRSNVSGLDRSVVRLSTSISFQGEFTR